MSSMYSHFVKHDPEEKDYQSAMYLLEAIEKKIESKDSGSNQEWIFNIGCKRAVCDNTTAALKRVEGVFFKLFCSKYPTLEARSVYSIKLLTTQEGYYQFTFTINCSHTNYVLNTLRDAKQPKSCLLVSKKSY